MQVKSLVKALEKAGHKIEALRNYKGELNGAYRIVKGDKVLSWHDQFGRAICVHEGRLSDPWDLQSDYHPGSFSRTVKSAVAYLAN